MHIYLFRLLVFGPNSKRIEILIYMSSLSMCSSFIPDMSMSFTMLLSECSDASNDARSRFHVNKRKQGLEAPFIKDNCKQEFCYVKPVCITESSIDGNLTGSKENKEDPERIQK